jgi:N-acetylneuraminic acid mutarotase
MHKLRIFSFVSLSGILLLLASCSKTNVNPSTGNWVRREDFGGNSRSEAVAFVIGDAGYIATGYDFNTFTTTNAQDSLGRYYDLWEYTPDPDEDFTRPGNWQGSSSAVGPGQTQLDSFPGTPRNSAVAFSIGDTAYVGTGFDGTNYLSDFWGYIASTNTWISLPAFPGGGRYDAVGFALQGKGYITTGYNSSYLNDCYQYNPANGGQWALVDAYPGPKCSQAVAFCSDDTTAYVCTGSNNGSTLTCNQLWAMTIVPGTSLNPSGVTWTMRRHISNYSTESYDDLYQMPRQNAVAFVLNSYAYLTTGNNGAERVDTWEYDIATDLWYQETSFAGAAREGAVAFSIPLIENANSNGRAFLGTGRSGPTNSGQFSDFYEWFPLQAYNALDSY